MIDTANLSNTELLTLCRQYGEAALTWRRKFLGLIPEVHKRKLYEQAGCSSVIEFAKKLAGISEEQVSRALNLDRTFEQMPALKTILNNGEVSVNKLARIASIATPENQEELAKITKALPMSALKTLVKDIRTEENVVDHKPQNNQLFEQDALELDEDVRNELIELQQKGINVSEIIRTALHKRQQTIEQEKETISNECQRTASRYIPARTRKLIKKEYGTKCSIKTCTKPSEEIHHSQRFSISKTHDPKYLAPLCKAHHILAHLADRRYEENRNASLTR